MNLGWTVQGYRQSLWNKKLVVLILVALTMLLMTTTRILGASAAASAAHILETGKPFLVYGTAWKKENTAKYVDMAVKSGFRFIDTACQPRHYQ